MRLHFVPAALTLPTAVEAFQAMYAALGGTDAWREEGRTPLDDPNWGKPQAREVVYGAGDATLVERVQAASGNPRDGWGYEVILRLDWARPGGPTRIEARSGGWEPCPRELLIEVCGVSGAELGALRGALRAKFGPDADRSHDACWAWTNVQALARAADLATARAWAEEGRARNKAGTSGRQELVAWLG
ncbi:MAG: hypothetical protein FJ090_22725, partial [Deltaproteobacteria bacterium]|nr:hypothetical protein [Deltaproteobacteria bacterium]